MIRKRLLAAIALYCGALASTYLRDYGTGNFLFNLAINFGLATAGMVFLHLRWRTKEQSIKTPEELGDTFK